MTLLLAALMALAISNANINNDSIHDAAVRLSGASSIEELSETELEHWQSLAEHPLDLNSASRHQLEETGLFSPYQTASLLDYISRSGDILSQAELAAVPGIGAQMAQDLMLFMTLQPHGQLGARRKHTVGGDATLRTSLRDGTWSTGFKGSLSHSSGIATSVAVKDMNLTSASLGWSGSGTVSRAVLGSFSARFGQGLLMWSGFSLSGLSTVGAFSRNATGVSPCRTFSEGSCHTGAAACLSLGKGRLLSDITALVTVSGLQAVNCSIIGHTTTGGVTLLHDPEGFRTSADFRTTIRKVTLYGEGALDFVSGGTAALLGGTWNIAYRKKAAVLLRAYSPSYDGAWAGAARSGSKVGDEYAAAAGVQLPWISATLDGAWHPSKGTHQLKAVSTLGGTVATPLETALGQLAVTPTLRAVSRFRPESSGSERWRNDIRADLDATMGGMQAHFRFNAVHSEDWAWLWYLEGGWKGALTGYLRFTLFKADSWADRIYVYERDMPGSFNVPACYGRGYAVSVVAAWKGLHMRLATTQYPWSDKEAHWELKLQLDLKSQNLKPTLRPRAGD